LFHATLRRALAEAFGGGGRQNRLQGVGHCSHGPIRGSGLYCNRRLRASPPSVLVTSIVSTLRSSEIE
jgi:hypothetical protein